jgi:hypothetical protein
MSRLVAAVPFPADEVRVGDVLLDSKAGEVAVVVTAVERLHYGTRIQTDNGADDDVETDINVTMLVPVMSVPTDGVALYKADGSRVLGCTCVYRLVEGQWERVWASEPHCTALGHGALVDDDED